MYLKVIFSSSLLLLSPFLFAQTYITACDACSVEQMKSKIKHSALWQGNTNSNCMKIANNKKCQAHAKNQQILVVDSFNNTFQNFKILTMPQSIEVTATTSSDAETNIAMKAISYRNAVIKTFAHVELDYLSNFNSDVGNAKYNQTLATARDGQKMKKCTFTNDKGKTVTVNSSTGLTSSSVDSVWDYIRSDAIITDIKNKLATSLNTHYANLAQDKGSELKRTLAVNKASSDMIRSAFYELQNHVITLRSKLNDQVLSFDIDSTRNTLAAQPYSNITLSLNQKTSKDWEGVSVYNRFNSRDNHFKSECSWDEYKDSQDRSGEMQNAEIKKLKSDWLKIVKAIELEQCQSNISLARKKSLISYRNIAYRNNNGANEWLGKAIYDEQLILEKLADEECEN